MSGVAAFGLRFPKKRRTLSHRQRPTIPTTPQPTATPMIAPTLIPGAKNAGLRKVEEVRWTLTEETVKTYWHYDRDGTEILVEEYEGGRLRKKVSTSYWKKDKIETQITSYYDEDGKTTTEVYNAFGEKLSE